MSNYITTTNASGKAVFSDKISTTGHSIITKPGGTKEDGNIQILYATPSFPVNLANEADLDYYIKVRTEGLAPGQTCPPNGVSAAILTLGPDAVLPLHQTNSLDIIVVLEGVVELHLDSGESKQLRAGDSVVQRSTTHQWKVSLK